MKRYIRSSTLDDIQATAIDLLSVPSVASVEIIERRVNYISCRLHYNDGTTSNVFKVTYDNIQSRKDAANSWNPTWSIKDDGTVINQSGEVQGYFKLLKKRPQSTSRDYKDDSLVVYYGAQSADLTEASAADVVENLHK